MSDENAIPVTVTTVKQWSNTLISFRITRPNGFKFTAGQFVRLGVMPQQLHHYQAHPSDKVVNLNVDKTTNGLLTTEGAIPIFRAYSVASSPYDEFIEFFSVVVPNGAFTSVIQYVQAGDVLYLNPTPFGYLTLARYQLPLPNDLWLLATGTGLAPFLSILKTLEVWQQYQHIILVYSARTYQELAYESEINTLKAMYGEDGAKFSFIPVITREPDFTGLKERLPQLIISGQLEQKADANFDVNHSHIMLCGNPQMVEDTKTALKQRGLVMNRRGEGNIAVENYW